MHAFFYYYNCLFVSLLRLTALRLLNQNQALNPLQWFFAKTLSWGFWTIFFTLVPIQEQVQVRGVWTMFWKVPRKKKDFLIPTILIKASFKTKVILFTCKGPKLESEPLYCIGLWINIIMCGKGVVGKGCRQERTNIMSL